MTAYRYQALDPGGKLVKGVMEGDSERHIRANLRGQRLRPVAVGQANQQADGQRLRQFFQPRLGTGDLALVTRQLATLVQSNLPLDECLTAVAEQTRKTRHQGILLQVRSRVAEGHTLAYALGEYPQIFNGMYRAMVNAGEHAGFLGPVLERLADYGEQRQFTQQKLQMAMIYPLILLAVALSVIAALLVYVVPELVGIFAHTNRELPLLTRALIATSDFLRESGLWLLLGLLAFWLGWRRWLKNTARRRRWHRLLLRMPVIGHFITAVDTARFASTLSILMASGVPLLDSLRIAGGGVDQSDFARQQRPCGRAGAGGRQPEPSLATERPLPAHDGAHDRQRRGQRRTGNHAGPLRQQPGAGTGSGPGRRHGDYGTADGGIHGGHGVTGGDGGAVADF